MQVREGMSEVVLPSDPATLCARRPRRWSAGRRRCGRARPGRPGPGGDHRAGRPHLVAAGEDPDTERVADHLTSKLTFASPEWSLERAADCDDPRGFRHLVVVESGELAGILSMRDIVRCWTKDGATSEIPAVRRSGPDRAGIA